VSRPRGSWRLWSDAKGVHDDLPRKRPPKATATRRVEPSGDGKWLEVSVDGTVVEVYTWVQERESGVRGAAGRAVSRTGT
jgi:hypothetical protein